MNPLRVLSSRELGEINDFLDELKDGTTYKKRLKEIQDAKKEVNDLIKVYGKVGEIEQLLGTTIDSQKKADWFKEEASDGLEASKREISAAKAASVKGIREREEAASKRIVDREKTLVDGEASLGRREKVYAKALDELIKREDLVVSDSKQAAQVMAQYTEAVGSLKKAIEDTQRAL